MANEGTQQEVTQGNGAPIAPADATAEQLAVADQSSMMEMPAGADLSPFSVTTKAAWELAQRKASAFAKSSIVPELFRGADKVGNCMIAMEYAARLNVSVLAVMQNMYLVHGNPGFKSTFVVATVNASQRFTPLRYEFFGEKGKDSWGCRCVAKDRETGEVLVGEDITISTAKEEGWYSRSGSKWKTIPGQMLRYRAAAFWARVYCPEIMIGFKMVDELEDIHGSVATQHALPQQLAPGGAASLEAAIGLARKPDDAPIDAEFEEHVDRETGEVSERELQRVAKKPEQQTLTK